MDGWDDIPSKQTSKQSKQMKRKKRNLNFTTATATAQPSPAPADIYIYIYIAKQPSGTGRGGARRDGMRWDAIKIMGNESPYSYASQFTGHKDTGHKENINEKATV